MSENTHEPTPCGNIMVIFTLLKPVFGFHVGIIHCLTKNSAASKLEIGHKKVQNFDHGDS